MKRAQQLLPSLFLALGTLGATFFSVVKSDSTPWVLTAAGMLAATIIGAGALERRIRPQSWTGWTSTVGVGLVFFAAAVIIAIKDPSRVPSILPILGGSAVVILGPSANRCCDPSEPTRAGATTSP